tara:strand:+ start:3237 stop:3572 length:336 start_codon:yes stop_codon:yes gene_type:complete
MAITIQVGNTLNISLQVGDTAWYTAVSQVGDQDYASNPQKIGVITATTPSSITIDSEISVPSAGDFIMFSKNQAVNNTSLLGYYAKVELKNNSLEHAELYAVSSEIAPSSK